jgi:hypothetical protein
MQNSSIPTSHSAPYRFQLVRIGCTPASTSHLLLLLLRCMPVLLLLVLLLEQEQLFHRGVA